MRKKCWQLGMWMLVPWTAMVANSPSIRSGSRGISPLHATDSTSPQKIVWEDVVFAGITLSDAQRAQITAIHAAHLARVADIAKSHRAKAITPATARAQLDALDAAQWAAMRAVLTVTQQPVFDRTRADLNAQATAVRTAAEAAARAAVSQKGAS
jgi:hypothetical protein